MDKVSASLVFSDEEPEQAQKGFDQYLRKRRGSFAKRIGPAAAELQVAQFNHDLQRIFSKIEKHQSSSVSDASLLAFGQVQSGKTAHMLGLLSWVADNNYGVAVVLTGVTQALHKQGQDRFKRELGETGIARAKILDVPTSRGGPQYKELVDTVAELVQRRSNTPKDTWPKSPLPILMTLKNRARIETTRACIKEALARCNLDLPIFIIDDEADQASPNSRIRLDDTSKTYAAISNLRATFKANVLVSYTATPQAVLLAPVTSALHPRECVMIQPGEGYFGIRNLVHEDYALNRLSIQDWPKGEVPDAPPLSLIAALRDFFIVAWIRNRHPRYFYLDAPNSVDRKFADLNTSVQMLIHQSVKTADHGSVKQIVLTAKNQLRQEVASLIAERHKNVENGSIFDAWELQILQIAQRVGVANEEISMASMMQDAVNLHGLIDFCRIIVVNSDKDIASNVPDSEENWDLHNLWIVIGGEILGRGLTFPQLVSTYFLRSASNPNVDTVSQQMRFCGYRSWYQRLTTLWAPDEIHESFMQLEKIERIVWSRATSWDLKETDLIVYPPSVAYVAAEDANFNPTRKVVWDPKLSTSTEKGTVLDELDYNPRRFGSKLQALGAFRVDTSVIPQSRDAWDVYEHLRVDDFQKLLVNWTDWTESYSKLHRIASLFQPDLGELGLSQIPITVMVHQSLQAGTFSELERGAWWKDALADPSKRTVRAIQAGGSESFESWKTLARAPQSRETYQVFKKQSSYEGSGERKLLSQSPHIATQCIIEPVFGIKAERSRDWNDVVALTVGILVVLPDGYSVRVVGH